MIPSQTGELNFSSDHLPLPRVLEYEPDRLILDAPWDEQRRLVWLRLLGISASLSTLFVSNISNLIF